MPRLHAINKQHMAGKLAQMIAKELPDQSPVSCRGLAIRAYHCSSSALTTLPFSGRCRLAAGSSTAALGGSCWAGLRRAGRLGAASALWGPLPAFRASLVESKPMSARGCHGLQRGR